MIQTFTNTPYDQLEVGMEAESQRLVLADDLYVFANSSGNLNPMHLPREDGDGDGLPEAVTPSMWLAAQISAVMGNKLPGPGTLYRSHNLEFCGRAHAGDEILVKVVLVAKEPDRVVRFHTTVSRLSDGAVIVRGEATVFAPEHSLSFKADDIPGLTVSRLASGLPMGGDLEFADELTLGRALSGRRELSRNA